MNGKISTDFQIIFFNLLFFKLFALDEFITS